MRKTIDKRLKEDIKRVKQTVSKGATSRTTDDRIRILHLSDLHFTRDTHPEVKLEWLLQDIRRKDGAFAAIESVEYLVISGDLADKGKDEGFEKARQFVEKLVDELGLSYQRCILVPGNHDLQDRSDAYEEQITADGKKVIVRSVENFPKRFEKFSKLFYHKIVQEEYPLGFAKQGIAYLFPETGIQFLTLNSAWQIDKHDRKKAGMEPSAVANVIRDADVQCKEAVARGNMSAKSRLLRIGVWHHASCGPEMIRDEQYLSNLMKAEMRICLHGDVHEMRTDLIGYRRPGKMVDAIGAGSFGSIAEGRPESTPRLYNLIEFACDLKSVRVHTRSQAQPDGAWQGWYEWPNPKSEEGRLPYFDIELT